MNTLPVRTIISLLKYPYSLHAKSSSLTLLKEIEAAFRILRKTRGDGNCFFRAFSFGLVEEICKLPIIERSALSIQLKNNTGDLLRAAQFDRLAYEDFFEELFVSLEECTDGTWLAAEWEAAPHRSHSLVVLLRLIASAYLRTHAEEYEPFLWELDGGSAGMIGYCQRFVECLGVESDQIHIIALSKALNVDVEIAYLDGSDGPLDRLLFKANDNPPITTSPIKIHMLYRPGHYDLLYPL